MAFELPKLPYDYNALEPYIDAKTMEIHHTKHHAGYVNNLNNAIQGTPLENETIESILSKVSQLTAAVRNNGGGHYNHSLFWTILTPVSSKEPKDEALINAIKDAFGSFEDFKKQFSQAAVSQFGSGWAWLIVTPDKKLAVCSTPNQDNPLMDVASVKGTPILGLDVWEHAYYLHYQNRRADYVANFWNIVNWDEVAGRYHQAIK
jgi:Fe-Mn family superoxide dismutase